MAPPPPPSASYLWKLDDFSSESEDDDDNNNNNEEEPMMHDRTESSNTLGSVARIQSEDARRSSPESLDTLHSLERIQNEEEGLRSGSFSGSECFSDDDEKSSLYDGSPKAKNKRKESKRSKKKKRVSSSTTAEMGPKRVSFGNCVVRGFERCLGTQVVPGDGGWPLGIETTPNKSNNGVQKTRMSVDEYEAGKQERLLERWRTMQEEQTIGTRKKKKQSEPPAPPLETRQWDYRLDKLKNPLFGKLTEQERMNLLLSSSTPESECASPKLASSPNSPDRPRRSCTRSRSGSFSEKQHSHRSRSGSFSEQYNDTYTQIEVHHVRNELETIRNSRTGDGATGCTCRKLDVYLLPPNAGKKAHHRRLKPQKVKEELRKRHQLPDNSDELSREELELLLHDIVEQEPCCTGNDCPCARQGIECQDDACSCWHSSHLTKGKRNTTSARRTPVEEMQERCGNPHGMYCVDLDKISAVRRDLLASLTVCPPVGMAVGSEK